MKTKQFIPALLLSVVSLSACSDSSTSGQSTPINETRENGVAPVQQTEGTPTVTIDTTMQRHTEQIKTGQSMQRLDTSVMPPHASTGSGASNTTDKSTTTGSSNKSH